MLDVIRDEIDRHRRRFGRRLHVGVFKLGGHGDFMQQLAFARAVRRRWPRREATVTLVSKFDKTGANDAMLRGCDFVDSCIQVPPADWRTLVQDLAPAFDVLYDVQYVAATFFRSMRRFAAEQAAANARLARYAAYYSRFPWANAQLDETGQGQWDMLARSSGLDEIRGSVPPDHPFSLASIKYGAEVRVRYRKSGGCMGRIIDQRRLLEKIAPELERRLIASGCGGMGVALRIETELGRTELELVSDSPGKV